MYNQKIQGFPPFKQGRSRIFSKTPQIMFFFPIFPRLHHISARVINEDLPTKVGALLVAFFAPISTMVGVVLFFVTLDTLSGIYKSYKERKRRLIKQKKVGLDPPKLTCFQIFIRAYDPVKMNLTITKVISYPIILLAFYVFDKMVLGIELPEEQWFLNFSFTNYMFVLLAAVDLFSFISNMGEATGHWSWRAASRILSKQFRSERRKNDSDKFDFTRPDQDGFSDGT